MSEITQLETLTTSMLPDQCEACKFGNQLERRVVLFRKIRLNVATDDFVLFGYIQCIGRIVPLLLLGIVLSVLQCGLVVENGISKVLESNSIMYGIFFAVVVLILVSRFYYYMPGYQLFTK